MISTAAARTYREVPFRHGVCQVCDEIQPVTEHNDKPTFVNKHGVIQKPRVLFVHGPRDNRCPGSHELPLSWLEGSQLPTWDEMSDLDKGAALMHVWKRFKERDGIYARENYPARYSDDPVLTGLDYRTASRHAAVVAGTHLEAMERLGVDEHVRLYGLALAAA